MDQTRANRIAFSTFCDLLESIRSVRGKQKLQLLFEFLQKNELLWHKTNSMYPIFRLLAPQIDRQRTYNMKQHTLGRVFVEMLGITENTNLGKMLRQWDNPDMMTLCPEALGDLPRVIEFVLTNRTQTTKNIITIQQVHVLLDEIVNCKSNTEYAIAIRGWTAKITPRDIKWMTRMILKDLKIGLSHERILSQLHKDAKDMYNHTNDLEKVCTTCIDPNIRYISGIQPFTRFAPMLAKRVDFDDCIHVLDTPSIAMEPKLDGERLLCHYKESNCQLYSRNGTDYTDLYGSIIPLIKSSILPGVDCVLDGELLVWDSMNQRYGDFGSLKTVAKAVNEQSSTNGQWLCYVLWDIVYLGNTSAKEVLEALSIDTDTLQSVMGLPLSLRRKLLERIVDAKPTKIELNQHIVVDSGNYHEIVMKQVDKMLFEGYEGLILKDRTAHYSCGETSRKSKRWLKLKPDYAGLTQDVDAIILGGLYGHSKSRGGITRYLVGVSSFAIETETTMAPTFLTLCRVGSGLSLDNFRILKERLDPHWIPWDPTNIPKHFGDWIPNSGNTPAFWIKPQNSIILQLKGFELTFSEAHSSGFSLRFPRVQEIRFDKTWNECSTAQDLNRIKATRGKRKAAAISQRGSESSSTTSRRTVSKPSVHQSLVANVKIEDITTESHIFKNMEFCVLPAAGRQVTTKRDIEKLIMQNGGSAVQNPMIKTTRYCVAIERDNIRVKNLSKQGKLNIITPDWIISCVKARTILPLTARQYVFANLHTRNQLAVEYDEYNDHYTNPCTVDELMALVEQMTVINYQEPWQILAQELNDEEQDVFESKATFFYHCCVFIGLPPHLSLHQKLMESYVRFYAGRIARRLNSDVTHIVIDKTQKDDYRTHGANYREKYGYEPMVVSTEWLVQCVAQKCQLDPGPFQIR